ncbi:MAG: type VI secretion system baseplate subunit TssG [Planctomycetales bacterium]|nr:type VI secretion system baseplate subunit TssG [Planctomycetales bacterium]
MNEPHDVGSHASAEHSARLSWLERRLYEDGAEFDFFQATALLEQLAQGGDVARPMDGRRPLNPAVRFEVPPTSAFPASAVDRVEPPEGAAPPRMAVNFMGLTGPSGVLPRHYTECIQQQERDQPKATRRTMRAWFDLFNNRLIGLFYRAWEKIRVDRGLARGEAETLEPDAFTAAAFSLAGLGQKSLRNRFSVGFGDPRATGETADRIRDWALLRYAGTLARGRRSAGQIADVLTDYFQVPISVDQFQGQWLALDPESRTSLGASGSNAALGVDAVAGSRVWDVQSRVIVRVGPLTKRQFDQFLPDDDPGPRRRRYGLLCQFARLLLGPELDFDVQLTLKGAEVPTLPLLRVATDETSRLGRSAWLATGAAADDVGDALFPADERRRLGASDQRIGRLCG